MQEHERRHHQQQDPISAEQEREEPGNDNFQKISGSGCRV
jgi:hypothetical protein